MFYYDVVLKKPTNGLRITTFNINFFKFILFFKVTQLDKYTIFNKEEIFNRIFYHLNHRLIFEQLRAADIK